MKKLSLLTRISCILVNWDPEILKECSRASVCQVKKLAFAMSIVLLVWGFNGFSIGSMFLHLPVWACLILAAVMALVVWMIENVVVLSVGKSLLMGSVRLGLGLMMALLGATLVDHYFFQDDIEAVLAADQELKVKEETVVLEQKYAADMAEKSEQMEQLRLLIEEKDAKIAKNPFVTKREYQTEVSDEIGADGKPIVREVASSVTKIDNPLVASRKADLELLAKYDEQYQESRMRKLNAANEAAEKYANVQHAGFLKMLDATARVVTAKPLNKVAYGVFFGIMLLLELFVLLINVGEKQCDYEKILIQQLEIKNRLIEAKVRASGM